jgi:hypothetical protein
MIFARDKSQMCNNLLQYAHVYAWGREHGRKVISMRFSYKYPFFKIRHTDLTGFGWYLLGKYASAVGLLPTASFKYAECDAEALERKMLRHRHIVVSGWYARWYDLFLKYRDEICDLFTIDAQYTEHVRRKMQEAEKDGLSPLRLGVHIRRGDYAVWKDGIYCYTDEQYADVIRQFAAMKPDQSVEVYLSTNDPTVSAADYQRLVANDRVRVHLLGGNAVEDLFMLSECDYLIGPPSTFSLVAAMYRDVPLCRMDQLQGGRLTSSDFRLFDYWFRILV